MNRSNGICRFHQTVGSDGITPALFRADVKSKREAFSRSQLAFLKGQRIEWDSIKHTLLPKPDGTRNTLMMVYDKYDLRSKLYKSQV